MLSLKDKVAFISGAGSVGDDPDAKVWGSGKATAVLLARQGARIYGVDLRKEAADITLQILANGPISEEADHDQCQTKVR